MSNPRLSGMTITDKAVIYNLPAPELLFLEEFLSWGFVPTRPGGLQWAPSCATVPPRLLFIPSPPVSSLASALVTPGISLTSGNICWHGWLRVVT